MDSNDSTMNQPKTIKTILNQEQSFQALAEGIGRTGKGSRSVQDGEEQF